MARTKGTTSVVSHSVGQQQLWQAMRVIRRFTVADLAMTCPAIGESGLRKYLQALVEARFVVLVLPRVSGRPGSRDTWQLVRDTGPLSPVARRRTGGGVYDRNTGLEHPAAASLHLGEHGVDLVDHEERREGADA